ncbi:MAG: hypothetical protein OXH57_04760, partial [Ekhidna sp.]|nr:hypothetical protein [Ekhidna sp.]
MIAGLTTKAAAQTVPTLKVNIPTVTEGETGTITLTLSKAANDTIEISCSNVSLTASGCTLFNCPGSTDRASPSDYSLPAVIVTFAPGETTKTVSFTTTDDTKIEPTEIFVFQIGGLNTTTEATIDPNTPPDGTTRLIQGGWFVRIRDNDPMVTLAAGTSPVPEGTAASFTVTRNASQTTALTVDLQVSENTTEGQAFVASNNKGSKEVIIPANQTAATYTVSTVGDNIDEPSGAVTVQIAAGTDYYVSGSGGTATVTVTDDDPTTVTLTTPDTEATEGSSDR